MNKRRRAFQFLEFGREGKRFFVGTGQGQMDGGGGGGGGVSRLYASVFVPMHAMYSVHLEKGVKTALMKGKPNWLLCFFFLSSSLGLKNPFVN